MGSPAAVARILHFGIFEVDLKACELRKHGFRLKLPEQPFQVLVVLLENQVNLSPARNCVIASGPGTLLSILTTDSTMR